MKQQAKRVSWPHVLFALRETARDMMEVRVWAVLGGLVLLVALAGPFYTMEQLDLAGRLLYWGTVGIAVSLMMWAINRVCVALLSGRWPRPVIGALAGVVGILPTMGLVALGNLAAGTNWPQAGFLGFFPYVAPTAIGISVLVQMLFSSPDTGTPIPGPLHSAGLFSRLPLELGKEIIAVQAQDHYVNIFTSRGSSLVLMRMGDATQDLARFPGIQIHRSWWVNLDHVRSLEKTETGGSRLVMSNGLSVPVPKSRRAEVRRAIAAREPGEIDQVASG